MPFLVCLLFFFFFETGFFFVILAVLELADQTGLKLTETHQLLSAKCWD